VPASAASEWWQGGKPFTQWQRHLQSCVGDENCLIVESDRPNRSDFQDEELPVYVWIHGGSNNFGTAKQYDGRALAIIPTFVGRGRPIPLGPLGCSFHRMYRPVLCALSDSGNFGNTDTIRAAGMVKTQYRPTLVATRTTSPLLAIRRAHNVLNLRYHQRRRWDFPSCHCPRVAR